VRVVKEKKTVYQVAAFCLFMSRLPINFDLLGGKRKYIEMETTEKLKSKQAYHLPPSFFLVTDYL
jgi:hypothetical protein